MLRSSVVVTFISLVSYLFSFITQLLVARVFGASAHLDAYLAAISVPFLFMTVTNGLFSFFLVPLLVSRRLKADRYGQFSALLLLFVLFLAVLLPGLAFFLSPLIIGTIMPTFAEELRAGAVEMLRFAWLAYGCNIVVSYLVSLHNAAKRFFVSALVTILPSLGMIGLLIMAGSLGPLALVWGMLAGNLAAIPLLFFGIRRDFSFHDAIHSQWREIGVIIRRTPLVLFFMLSLAIYPTIDVFWATRLGAGNLSYLGYGQKLLVSLGNIILLGPLAVMQPYLAEAATTGQFKEFRSRTLGVLRMLFFYLSLIMVTVSLLRFPVVKLLFERGAFDQAATRMVGSLVPGMSLGVMAMIIVVLLLRVLFAKGDITGAAQLSGAGALLYFSLSGLFSAVLGLQGIIAAYACTWLVLLSWAFYRLWKGHFREVLNMNSFKYLYRLAFALSAAVTLLWLGYTFLVQPAMNANIRNLLLSLLFTVGMGTAGFLLVTAKYFKMPEILLLIGLLPLHKLR